MTEPNIPTQSGERLSFYQLFKQKAYQVEIPIIQRDYAQGRKNTHEVRSLFLDALYDYLEENQPHRDLDFVYGSLTKGDDTAFVPLDGQQRLTTLFLLHWYLANISGNLEPLREVLNKQGATENTSKSKFTYETRTSSREFCDALLAHGVSLDGFILDENKSHVLSNSIKDSSWYYLSWQNDPTIQSMLTMLDAIHIKFKDKPEFYERLVDEENPIITFLFLNLHDFGLTDDLYIKMNSRGKPLSGFETFKAKLEQYIEEHESDFDRQRKLAFDDVEKEVTTAKYFMHRMDAHWADLFWKYRSETNLHFDDQLMNFVKVVIINQYASDLTGSADRNLNALLDQEGSNQKGTTFFQYQQLNALSSAAVSYLIYALDQLSGHPEGIPSHLPGSHYYNETSTFLRVLAYDISYPQRLYFHAYIKFLIYYNDDLTGFDDWMRVVFNLIEGSRFDSATDFVRAIRSIEGMIPQAKQIWKSLESQSVSIEGFLSRQIHEERVKASLLLRENEDWNTPLFEVEKNAYFNGQIAFLLEFSGILDYYEEYGHCNWSTEENDTFLNDFTQYANKAKAVFSSYASINDNFVWERAVLSKGNYLIDTTAERRNFLNTAKNLRDYSWKRLLRLPAPDAEPHVVDKWKTRRSFVKAVFDDEKFDKDNLDHSLEQICDSLQGGWRDYFIKSPYLMHYCESGFIRFEGHLSIRLLSKTQANSYHAEMYSYHFYHEYLNENDVLKPFQNQHYNDSNSIQFVPVIELYGFSYDRREYRIMIGFDKDNKYWIDFYKHKGKTSEAHYSEEVREVLANQPFQWGKTTGWPIVYWHGYVSRHDTHEACYEGLVNLCEQLDRLET